MLNIGNSFASEYLRLRFAWMPMESKSKSREKHCFYGKCKRYSLI